MDDNRQLVEKAFQNWGAGKGSILDLMSDEGIVVIPGTASHCGTMSKRRFVAEVAAPFMKKFRIPPVPVPSTIMAEGDDVIVVATARGSTLNGDDYRNDYVFVLEFKQDRLVKATEFLDMAAFNKVWDSVRSTVPPASLQAPL